MDDLYKFATAFANHVIQDNCKHCRLIFARWLKVLEIQHEDQDEQEQEVK